MTPLAPSVTTTDLPVCAYRIARKTAGQVAKAYPFLSPLVDDIEQDLLLAMVTESHRYDAELGAESTFYHYVAWQKSLDIRKYYQADCRHRGHEDLRPQDEMPDGVMGECESDGLAEEWFTDLPEHLRRIAEAVARSSVNRAAIELGTSRRQIMAGIDEMQRRWRLLVVTDGEEKRTAH